MQGTLHPSLRAYIDCFHSAPMPKMYPRGGGPWDQDPILMRDFRIIRAEEVRWKENKEKMDSVKSGNFESLSSQSKGGGTGGLGGLEEMFNELEEEGGF